MSRFQVLPLPIKSYSIATFSAATALLLITLLLFALKATPAILLFGAAMVGAWYAGLKSAEQELEIERQIISKVIDTAACLIVVLDSQGRIVRFNQACEKTTGYSVAEVVNKYVWDLFLISEEIEPVQTFFSQLNVEVFYSEYQNYWRTKNGSKRFISWSNTVTVDGDGLVEYVIASGIDITDRKEAEIALALSYAQLESRVKQRTVELRTLLENTPDAIIRIDKELRYIYVNQAVASSQGKPVSFFLGKTSQEIGTPPELCQIWDETLRKVFETGREEIIEFQTFSTDGIRSYQSRIVPEFDQDGIPESALIVARDITELKLAETQRLQLTIEQAAREKAETEQQRSAFLAEVSKMLAATFDGETVLQNVAELAVNSIADGCCIHLTETDSKVRQVAVAHAEPSTVDTLNNLRIRSPIDSDAVNGYPLVIRTGKSELIAEVDAEILAAVAENAAEIEILRSLDIGSHACVPLRARGRVMGAISCFTSKVGRRYSAGDMAMLEDLAYRVAIALDNARLYAKAQQALSQTSESFALIDSLLEASPLGICFLDREMRFIRINQVLAELNGLPAEQHLGEDFRELFPESAVQFAPIIKQVLETGQPVLNVEISGESQGKPGYFGHWLANYYPVKNERGEISGAGIILADISAAKQTELALTESEMRFRSVVESNMIGIGFWDANGEVTGANDALLEMIGYTREDLVSGQISWVELTPPEYGELDRAALKQVAESGSCAPFEKEYIRSDGTRFPVLVGGGNFQGCKDKGSFFVLDITDRKQAQNQNRENEIRIRRQLAEIDLVYNTTPVGLSFVDTNLRYIRINKCLAEINGRSIADHIGRTVREAIPEIADMVEPIYRQVLATQTPVLDLEIKAETLQQPGVVRDWQVSFYPVSDESGTLLGVSSVVAEITDRNQAKRVIQQSEAIFRRLLESNIFGVAIGDFSGRIAYANDSLLKMVGYTRSEQLSGQMRWDRMTPPEYLHLDAKAAQEIRAKGVATPFKKEYIRKDGSRVPILMGGTILCPDDRAPETIVAFYIDLTEISRVEAELKNNQERLQIAQQAGKIGTFEWNVQTGEVACTPELVALYGLPIGGLDTYQNWLEMLHPDDRAVTEQQVQAAGASGEELNIEFRICRPDKSVGWIACRAKVFQDDRGLPLRMIGVNVDISDRKQAEEARSQINQTLEALIRACPLAITVLDADNGTVKMWNPAAERIFGWSESEVVGQFVPSIPVDKRQEFMANLQGIRAGNAIAGMETQRQRKDGSSIDIGLWATPVRDGKGNINCMSIVADISDRKQVEAERAQLLDREQAARAEAEAINRLKDEFLATLSHELRTPLNAILGWAQILRRGKYTEASLANGLEAIERQSRVQVQLVEDLLDVSRIIQGKLALKPGWFSMVKTIEVALNSVNFVAEAKPVTVSSEFDPTVGLMWGDTQRLQQVVSNLLTNAVKFTPAGGSVRLQLSAVAVTDSPSPNHLQIIVSDTGKGISAEFLPYVFDRFRQADGSITRADSGLGLGLAIVRHLVKLHGGTVTAESPGEGLGATFTVMLPLKQRRNQQSQLRGERKIPQMRQAILAGVKVLVVDDEPDNRQFLVAAIEQLGATATAAASAAEAIDILQQSPPNILVSDIGMPVEDGYSLIRKVRSSELGTAKRLPAVALTAYASESDRDRAIAAGYDEHLAKPINSALFAAVLARLKNSQ